MSNSEQEKVELITFLDSVQRTIIAQKVEENDNFIKVKNPVVVNIVPQTDQAGRSTGQMALQLLPLYFKEFLTTKNEPIYFTYPKQTIVTIDPFKDGFDFKLHIQYSQIFQPPAAAPTPAPQAPVAPPAAQSAPTNTPVINLFEE